ncbi:MAG: 4a-hydroxytetrahydrobiopterin dehydratase [Chlorobiaceae bacterium]|nr:4a-hydroxytetrahydrobiopterin dehydratase [Chlorobiaceae bacterium]
MTDLQSQHCAACSGAETPMAEEELQRQLKFLPEWRIVEDAGERKLVRLFTFPDFNEAIGFSVKVAELADSEGHHPSILTEWGKVTVSWWTHATGGIHLNDLIMASKTDRS